MLEVAIDGIYESETGTGQKDYIPFTYKYETSRFSAKGLFTHALRRHAPYLIQNDKKNSKALYSRIKALVITDVKKINDKCALEGKDILNLNAWELQELACMYDLYEIPLHGEYAIAELREKAAIAYMERILKIPMKTNKEKDELEFFEKQDDGTYLLKADELELPVEVFKDFLQKNQKEKEKKSLAYFRQKAKNNKEVVIEDDLDANTNSISEFPSMEELSE